MNFFNASSRKETLTLSAISGGAVVTFLLLVVVSFGCAPIKGNGALKAPVATPASPATKAIEAQPAKAGSKTVAVTVKHGNINGGATPPIEMNLGTVAPLELGTNEVFTSSRGYTEQGYEFKKFQKLYDNTKSEFDYSEWGNIAVVISGNVCSVNWAPADAGTLTVNGKNAILSPVSELKFLTKEYAVKNVFSESKISVRVGAKNRLEVVETTPAGLELTFLTKNKAPAGHTYSGSVKVVSLGNQQKFFLTLAETDKGFDAQCVATPGF